MADELKEDAGAYDRADDLFGYPPLPHRRCPGCGLKAEPFLDGCCWLCCASGQRELVMNLAPADYWNQWKKRGVL